MTIIDIVSLLNKAELTFAGFQPFRHVTLIMAHDFAHHKGTLYFYMENLTSEQIIAHRDAKREEFSTRQKSGG